MSQQVSIDQLIERLAATNDLTRPHLYSGRVRIDHDIALLRLVLQCLFDLSACRADGWLGEGDLLTIAEQNPRFALGRVDALLRSLGSANVVRPGGPEQAVRHIIIDHGVLAAIKTAGASRYIASCEYPVIEAAVRRAVAKGHPAHNRYSRDTLWRPPAKPEPARHVVAFRQPDGEAASELSVALASVTREIYQRILADSRFLAQLPWQRVEDLVCQILKDFGYEVDGMRRTKDGGIDVFAVQKNGAFGPELYVVQVKHWARKVGVSPVRELEFVRSQYRATKGCLATTSHFTQGAWELFHQYRWVLEPKDYDGIMSWVRQAWNLAAGTRPHH
jgi:hypothetical protein